MRNELIEEYIDFEKNVNNLKSPRNKLRYPTKKLFTYLENTGKEIDEIGISDAKEYIVWLKEEFEYAAGTLSRFLQTASGFYNYLKKQGKVIENPFMYVKKIKMRKSLPKGILKEEEMKKLLDNLSCYYEEKDIREMKRKYLTHVISELFYSTGIRATEAAGIREEDIDFMNGTIKIDDTKAGKRRTVFLNDYAKEVIWLYVTKVRKWYMYGNSTQNKFFGMCGERLITSFNKNLKEVCKKAGLPIITSHSFRHSMGYQLLKSGCDIRYIQELLGHQSIRNTEIYTRIDSNDLRKVVENCHPRKIRKEKQEVENRR